MTSYISQSTDLSRKGFWEAVTIDNKPYVGDTGLIRSLIFNPPFQLLFQFRLAQLLRRNGIFGRFVSRIIKNHILKVFNCDISLLSTIEPGVFFPHPLGIVIGENVFVSSKCRIYQNVTIGRKNYLHPSAPSLSTNVVVYAGAVIVGNCNIGENSIIGANCVVTEDIEMNTMHGIAKSLNMAGKQKV